MVIEVSNAYHTSQQVFGYVRSFTTVSQYQTCAGIASLNPGFYTPRPTITSEWGQTFDLVVGASPTELSHHFAIVVSP